MRLLFSTIGGVFCLLLTAAPAMAVQAHGGSEGLVAHQIGHLLFFAGMFYLLCTIGRSWDNGLGWREFKRFLWLILLWNVLTFSGHWLHECVPVEKYLRQAGRVVAFAIDSPVDAYFYLTRLDHLLLVPAFAFLLRALYRWREEG